MVPGAMSAGLSAANRTDPKVAARNDATYKLKPFPGENALKHVAEAWKQDAVAVLAALKLLTVADGKPPNRALELKVRDVDARFPAVPHSHPEYLKQTANRQRLIDETC